MYVLEPELNQAGVTGAVVEPHSMDPVKVLRMARELGSTIERVLLVGCEPQPLAADDDMQMEMSEPVQAAVEEAITLIESLVTQILANGPSRQDWPTAKLTREGSARMTLADVRSCTNSRSL